MQAALREHGLDGWLFYDHHHRDPLAYKILGLDAGMHVTRRWFYLVPAVGEPRKSYWGERKFPLILQNVHRYFLYLALLFLVLLARDAWHAMWFLVNGHEEFQIHVGTLIMIIDPILLGGYTLGCHSLRHLVGGRKDVMGGARKKTYDCVTCLNGVHMKWAWFSLFWVMFTDIYVRLSAMGIWNHDWRLF